MPLPPTPLAGWHGGRSWHGLWAWRWQPDGQPGPMGARPEAPGPRRRRRPVDHMSWHIAEAGQKPKGPLSKASMGAWQLTGQLVRDHAGLDPGQDRMDAGPRM